jgi:hypothetical protein
MANKETKVLVEGFRMFLKNKLSEAPKLNPAQGSFGFMPPEPEAPAKPAKAKKAKKQAKSGNPSVIKIFDFGGTLFMPSNALLNNPFFYLSLSPEGMILFDEKLQAGGNIVEKNINLVDSYSYILSRVSSFGPNKDHSYFKGLLAKGDQKLKGFMELLGMPVDESSIDTYFLDGGQSLQTYKEFISTVTGVEPSRVIVAQNKSEDSKSTAAAEIANKHPGASFEVYDNSGSGSKSGDMLAKVRNALEEAGAKNIKLFLVDGTSISKA